jgi:hypothetical protein
MSTVELAATQKLRFRTEKRAPSKNKAYEAKLKPGLIPIIWRSQKLIMRVRASGITIARAQRRTGPPSRATVAKSRRLTTELMRTPRG